MRGEFWIHPPCSAIRRLELAGQVPLHRRRDPVDHLLGRGRGQGLDLQHPVKTPAAEIRIELRSADQKTVLAHTTTADDGRFQFDAPANAGRVSFVVMAELRT